jgi:hypothetical protein
MSACTAACIDYDNTNGGAARAPNRRTTPMTNLPNITIPALGDRYVLTTGFQKDGSGPFYYTGRGGEGWLGAKAEAFTYGYEAAARKAALLNRMREVHGQTFWLAGA